MTVFISIGFHYLDGFPGLLDLAGVKKIFSCQEMITITDVGKEDSKTIHQLVNKIGGLESFYSQICCWQNYFVVSNQREFEELLNRFVNQKIVFYYSGHGTPEGLLLPSQEVYPWFRLLEVLRPQRFYGIFDCCHSPNFSLAFEYEKDKWIYNQNWNFDRRMGLIFSACHPTEKILNQTSLSEFTKIFGNWWLSEQKLEELCLLSPSSKIWTSNPWEEEELLTELRTLVAESRINVLE